MRNNHKVVSVTFITQSFNTGDYEQLGNKRHAKLTTMKVRLEKDQATDDSTGRDLWQNRPVETSCPEGSSSSGSSIPESKGVSLRRIRSLHVTLKRSIVAHMPFSVGVSAIHREGVSRWRPQAGTVFVRSVGPDRATSDRVREDRPGRPTSYAVRCGAVWSRSRSRRGWSVTCLLRRKPGLARRFSVGRSSETVEWGCLR